MQVLKALQNASVVTDPKNPQIVSNGGPSDVQALVASLGVKSASAAVLTAKLSSGIELISKPSQLECPTVADGFGDSGRHAAPRCDLVGKSRDSFDHRCRRSRLLEQHAEALPVRSILRPPGTGRARNSASLEVWAQITTTPR